jgi:PiT family inorganic phosphate transporter
VLAGAVAIVGTYLAYRLTRRERPEDVKRGFRYGQIASASLVSLAHGTNDAQKTMGVITLALIAHGSLGASASVPLWVILSAGVAIGSGTYIGGWRVIRTMGTRITDIEEPQGFASQSAAAAVILAASHYGLPLSTTHVTSGSIIGAGVGKRFAAVHWGVAGRLVIAWLITLPAAALAGAGTWWAADAIGGTAGALVMGAVGIAGATALFLATRHDRVDADNVIDRAPAVGGVTLAEKPALVAA